MLQAPLQTFGHPYCRALEHLAGETVTTAVAETTTYLTRHAQDIGDSHALTEARTAMTSNTSQECTLPYACADAPEIGHGLLTRLPQLDTDSAPICAQRWPARGLFFHYIPCNFWYFQGLG